MRAFPLLCLLVAGTSLRADSFVDVVRTEANTLNDLIRKVPVISQHWDKPLRRLSAVQEQLYLHERKMRGEGLPPEMAEMFSANYSAIFSALVEDRLTEECGRELLSIHRQILDHTHRWLAKRVRDERFPKELADNMTYFRGELERHSIPLAEVPDELRTPVVNGYQAWVGELLAWGESCGGLAPGDLSRIRVKADELERFERAFKRDGRLQPHERELLHGRFLKLTRETIEVVSR